MAGMHDIERESLPAHIAMDEQRHEFIENQLKVLDQRIEKIEGVMEDILHKIEALAAEQSKKWDSTQMAVISGLVGLVLWLVSRLIGGG